MKDMVQKLAIVGAGMIGASWAALGSAHGVAVSAYDPNPEAEARFLSHVERARTQLAELGLTGDGAVSFSTDLAAALDGAGFVQENGPENEAVKRRLLAEIDALLPPGAIIASSTSALVRSAIVADCERPERIVVAHPFNPPHLVPLVEIVGADVEVVARAADFYRALGRRPVVLNREMPGHIANRLASALYREAVHLVEQGVASVADIDAALCNGPGLRWALMGPHMTYHLGGGEGGISGYLAHLGPSQVRRWQSLGNPSLDAEVQAKIVAGVAEEAGGRSIAELELRRDEGLLALLKARTLVSD
ncbi:3-hydroxyacyl-CoA dehydrogenase NAD-binding domain-containing protein [Bosea vaviloviae]|uniref:L-gulonate 3-dehydrogenase n=1 Tax=Bosea vaviloviae TaxID=1526658 RepID=A0A0N1N1J0_9HYPH|nr:3-hydroxyacyl-CoA dehydrogenase NAD-binding domain-containing protein [Bosea vaviloviae]KPH81232.1 3-hydroxyacyl-CoA dehydrogenase [Bosea vaviloviae]